MTRGRALVAAAVAAAIVATAACSGGGGPPGTRDGSGGPRGTATTGTSGRDEPWFERACGLPPRWLRLIERGHHQWRSPDVYMLPGRPNFIGTFDNTTHSGPWPYLQDVPLVFYGPGFIRRQGEVELDREVTLADIAPTVAELLGTEFDQGSGQVIDEVLEPEDRREDPPKLVLTVVWDGAGWNVLDRWPDEWPHLASLIEGGTTISNATVGSSPTVTPAVHATIGTGAFPRDHGVVDIWRRKGVEAPPAFAKDSPRNLKLPTLADVFDQAHGNEPEVGMVAGIIWHLGMLGHGAEFEGGDRDIAAWEDLEARLQTNPEIYTLPSYLNDVPGFEEIKRTIDLEDGRLDDIWMDHRILDVPSLIHRTPVRTLYQTRQIQALIAREGFGADDTPDLFFTNYKQIDLVGHIYNMINPEMPNVIGYTDVALKNLTTFLNDTVGAEEWVLVLTADHGQAPLPESIGAWPINIQRVMEVVAGRFDVPTRDLFQRQRPNGFWLDPVVADREGITASDVATELLDYTIRDDARGDVPDAYADRADEQLFQAAWPARSTQAIVDCAGSEAG